LAELTESLAAKQAEITMLHEKHIQHGQELQVEQERVADERERSRSLLGESATTAQEAREHLIDARNQAQALVSNAELKMQRSLAYEQLLLHREKEVNTQFAHIEKEKIGILNRERTLKDRYATLERTINRLKSKK